MNTAGQAPGSSQSGPKSGITHLLYLHGFRSSPRSTKARQVAAWMQAHRPDVHWWCPQLPPSPREAMQLVFERIAAWPRLPQGRPKATMPPRGADAEGVLGAGKPTMAVIGSSLGGFYATVVAERTGCPAVLLNPAVDPARDLAAHIGEQTSWHEPDDRFYFRAEFVHELKALAVPAITRPQRYFAVIAKGDEVLDWREMTDRYAGARVKLLEGGDHALSGFDQHLPDVLEFLHLA